MTRLFRDGRTETVRSCTSEMVAFVNSMDNENFKVNLENTDLWGQLDINLVYPIPSERWERGETAET